MKKASHPFSPPQHTTATTRKSVHRDAYMFYSSTPLHDGFVPAWNASIPNYYDIHIYNSTMQPDTIVYVLLLIYFPSSSKLSSIHLFQL